MSIIGPVNSTDKTSTDMAITVLLLALALASVSGQSDNCANKENCNAEDANQFMIRCNSEGSSCSCTPGTEDCPADDPAATKPTDSSSCEEVCGNTTACVFYKFKKVTVLWGPKLGYNEVCSVCSVF